MTDTRRLPDDAAHLNSSHPHYPYIDQPSARRRKLLLGGLAAGIAGATAVAAAEALPAIPAARGGTPSPIPVGPSPLAPLWARRQALMAERERLAAIEDLALAEYQRTRPRPPAELIQAGRTFGSRHGQFWEDGKAIRYLAVADAESNLRCAEWNDKHIGGPKRAPAAESLLRLATGYERARTQAHEAWQGHPVHAATDRYLDAKGDVEADILAAPVMTLACVALKLAVISEQIDPDDFAATLVAELRGQVDATVNAAAVQS